MVFKNGYVFLDNAFRKVDFEITKNKIVNISDCINSSHVVDCNNKYIIPGFIELHSHGCIGSDFTTANSKEIHNMCSYYAKNGITSILATTMTIDFNIYKNAMRTLKDSIDSNNISNNNINTNTSNHITGSKIIGINMEGPFLGKDKKGAHDKKYLLPIDIGKFEELNQLSGNNIRIVNIDPNLDNAMDFIKNYSNDKIISLAHTSCSYNTALEAIHSGASHITHLFNAMNGLHHREPGLIGAFSDTDITAELICDGIHIHPSVIRMMYKVNPSQLIIISDSMSAAGLKDGFYELGGQKVMVKDKKATLEDGTIAGSTITIYDAFKKAIDIGIPIEQVIQSTSIIPARAIKLDDEIGSIAIGKSVDFLILDSDYRIEHVYINGVHLDN